MSESFARRLIGVLAVPIGLGIFYGVVKLLAPLLPQLVDLRGWIATLAGIVAGGVWVDLVDHGPGSRLIRFFTKL